MNHKTTLVLLSQFRRISTSSSVNARKNHYDSLGLTKNATQADVKGAYYELSKVYHPDKNQGITVDQQTKHSQKFRDITQAYEVLGNVKTRRLYDKGFFGEYQQTTTTRAQEDPLHKFHKSRETRHRPPAPSGKTPVYNFDEWSKAHYGAAFRRSQEMKIRHALHAEIKRSQLENNKHENLLLTVIVFFGFCMFIKEMLNSSAMVFFGGKKKDTVKDAD